ncbi:hypothetical protein DH2020_008159 [Rehmannia glutinosa]|uniref:Inactive heme oxygenase 2, chloroplastic n=1 Tax=Rehmannia glutinosa TaxID=99300 RepID=A0ABR0U118_REHGL
MAYLSTPATALKPSTSLNFLKYSYPLFFNALKITKPINRKNISRNGRLHKNPLSLQCTNFNTPTFVSETESEYETEEEYNSTEEYEEGEDLPPPMVGIGQTPPPVKRRRHRYRKKYPGEEKGITEEMRFVAMKLRNNGKVKSKKNSAIKDKEMENEGEKEDNTEEKNDDGNGDTWQPSMEGFLKYLVDSELVFRTVERIVDESSDVSYVYFRKTGLERSDCILKDLEWLSEQGNVIPEPSNPGVTYVQCLNELAENNPPLFLSHFYNIYFSHIAGGQVIAKQVSKKLLEGRELEFYKWEGDAEELLRGVREKLNALGEHWSRDEKNKCLRESTKAFRFLGQIVRLIIL